MIVEGVRVPRPGRGWPFTLPPVAHVVEHGLRFEAPVTFLVGENGSGKSTLVEAIAEAYGLDVRGGHAGRRYAPDAVGGPLGAALRLERSVAGGRMVGRRARGFFLRAESAQGVFEAMEGVDGYGPRPAALVSHGESFLQVLDGRFAGPGLYLLDEPETPLSFTSCLQLLARLHEVAADGAQVVCATHSPVLTALPGAVLLELGDHGVRRVQWDDLDVVAHQRRFLADPSSYLRHLL